MRKKDIARSDLKTDFLKSTIIRIDYDYLFDDQIEKIKRNLDDFLGKQEYHIENATLAEINFSVDMDDMLKNGENSFLDTINVDNDKRENYSSFINKEKNITIDITKGYSSITVNYKSRIHFEEIKEVMEKIIFELKTIRAHLSITRVGLRKTNVYIIKDLNKINDYFETHVFCFKNSIDNNSIMLRKCMQVYNYEKYIVNEITAIEQGTLTDNGKEQEVNQVALDFDIYLKDVDVDAIDFEDMNNKIFELYKSALKEEFLNKLRKENFSEEGLFNI